MNVPTKPKIKYIPLNKLVLSEQNVRRTLTNAGIAELAANIAAQGLHQNLNVILRDDGTAEVTAGGRRLRALKLLADDGTIPADWPVPCLPLAAREDAREVSLAENTMRAPMHPDDEFEAFNNLVTSGVPIEDVAARYGVTPAVVKQRMKLAAVSPKLRKLFREGKMTLQQVMAFTLTDDVKKQEKAWRGLDQWEREDADNIKAVLTENSIPGHHKLARFVGLKAYEKAGGTITRDLFDDDNAVHFDNPELLQQLAEQKLEAEAAKLQKEGWAWTKATIDPQYATPYGHLTPINEPDPEDPEYEAAEQRMEEEGPQYSAEQMETAGTTLSITHDGRLSITRGLVMPKSKADAAPGKENEIAQPPKPEYSNRLMDELAHQHTNALRHALAQDPNIALVTLTHALTSQVLYDGRATSALNIRAISFNTTRPEFVPNPEECPAIAALDAARAAWMKKLPKDEGKLFAWLMKQEPATITELLTFSTALTLQATIPPNTAEHDRRPVAQQVAKSLTSGFDMAAHWEATAEGFLGRLSKAQLAKALEETKQAPLAERILKMKREDAIRETARALKGKGWLPTPLKPSSTRHR
ncbi:ParB/RepB/Spo0J family partition protein [Hyphomicrobium sp. CS1BSMeth3]|uniref:ParB/RepB/Spo0J family partition protein n=1 Tax=Hyphomicrobium sp. CS1BSMeth3 TaxID=1892844 RepID=UPI0009306E26|nr:ParB/RepB/Spo0J family partition protein [Hyphomicrobium sp. CS1BSMeth3]